MKWKKAASRVIAAALAVIMALGSSGITYAAEGGSGEQSVSGTSADYELQDLVQYVNPLIGSNNFKGDSEYAGLAPFVTAPFGMTNFTPQTRENRIGGISYLYGDSTFKGLFATHQPAIWMGDYGYFNVMPQIGDVSPGESTRGLSFTHEDELSTPYYYRVTAGKSEGKEITSEMTATERCAIYRFTYPETSEAKIFVESARGRGNGSITVDLEKGEIYGWNNDNMSSHLNDKTLENLKGYFVIQFTKVPAGSGTYVNYETAEGQMTAEGQKSGAYLTFGTEAGETVEMRIGTSFISVDQARKNIEQEIGDRDFDTVKEELKNIWNEKLNVIQIEGATEDEKTIFYTAMFHALMYPRMFYENVDGTNMYYSPYDDSYHEGISYTDMSLWDTFRAQNSFLTLAAPERINDIINSLLQNYQEGGYMPKWPNPGYTNIMIGTHADSLVAEAINKGFDGFDYDLAYEAVFKDAMYAQEGDGTIKWADRQSGVPYEARGGLSAYKALGYIPNGYVNENVSRTIEFAYDDWCVAQVAKAVGKDEEAAFFLNRSLNYKNAINPETGYAMGRDVEGNFTTSGEGFTEGDRRKYTWFAPHDPQGLLNLMTEYQGEDFYNTELEKAFGGLGGSKWIEQQNEPCHHYAYMFDFSGRPDLTQKYARQTLEESYTNDTNGELGNDDCGQMSAWYVFSAMGFYPVNPASGEYMIGSPIFDKVTIHNPQTGTEFVITAPDNDGDNYYIQSAQLNGESLDIPMITYQQITEGGQLDFVMGDTASDWASDYRKEAIVYDETVEPIEDPQEPAFFGDSEVVRVTGENVTEGAKVSATNFRIAGSDIGDPATSLIDGNYDFGYISQDITNADLAENPYYLTMEWDEPKEEITSLKIWSNYAGSQNPTKLDIEVKNGEGEWTAVLTDCVLQWQNVSGGDNRCNTTIDLGSLTDVYGLRIRIKEANLSWGHIAVRELEVFKDFPEIISVSDPADYVANITYCRNTLEKVLYKGAELTEGSDYVRSGDKKDHITVYGSVLAADGADADAVLEFVFSQGKSHVEHLVIWNGWRANLESLVSKAEVVDRSPYTQNTVDVLDAALNDAKTLLETEAEDAALEEMSDQLKQALDGLVLLFNGYEKLEFEEANSYADGIQIEDRDDGKTVGYTFDGAWFMYDGVAFGESVPDTVTVRYAAASSCAQDSRVEIRLDGMDGELLATVDTPPTGDWGNFVTVSVDIDDAVQEKLTGTHPICLVLRGGSNSLPNYNWLLFEDRYQMHDVTNGQLLEAEDFDDWCTDIHPVGNGPLKTEPSNGGSGDAVANTFDGAWIKFDRINFGDSVINHITANYKTKADNCPSDSRLEIRQGAPDGELLATVMLPEINESGWSGWKETTSVIENSKLTGVMKDIYVVFCGDMSEHINWYICNLDYLKFEAMEEAPSYGNLTALIEEAEELDLTGYTEDSVKTLEDALEAAREIDRYAAEEDVQKAIGALEAAIGALTLDRSDLEAAVGGAETALERAGYYTIDSADALRAALDAAKAVLDNDGADAAAIARAAAELRAAVQALVPFEFDDVDAEDWYYDAVHYVYGKKVMTGFDPTTFKPLNTLLRAEFATTLYRMSGSPEMEYSNRFPDVHEDSWFVDPVLWAAENGIVTGYSQGPLAGYFDPATTIQRQQIAVMLYRYANFMGYDTSETASFEGYVDGDKVDEFAEEAMAWAVGSGMISGKYEQTVLDPQGSASRAECAIMLQRFIEKYGL